MANQQINRGKFQYYEEILATQENRPIVFCDYVEAQKVMLEPSESILGQPKMVEEIESYIDAYIVED